MFVPCEVVAILSYSQKLKKNAENRECDLQHNGKPQALTGLVLISAMVAQKRDPKNQRNEIQQITARWNCRNVYSDTPLIDHSVMREFVSGPPSYRFIYERVRDRKSS